MEKKKSKFGFLTILLKFGKIALKFSKILFAGVTFAGYSYMFSWRFAIALMLMIFFHETGHVWAMRKRGIKTKGFYFIPFFGGAAIAQEDFKTRDNEAYIALMGPIWGLGLSIVPALIYLFYPTPLMAAIASWWALINLINLLPINPLDGGRITKSIVLSTKPENKKITSIILLIVSILLLILTGYFQFWVLVVFGVIGLVELLLEIFDKRGYLEPIITINRFKYFGAYLLVSILLIMVIYSTKHVPGADTAMDFLMKP